MADDSNISLPSSGRVPASSTDQPKLAPIFGAAGSGKRAREIHGEGSLADSVQTITVSTSLQGQDGITKKLKVEQTTSVLSDGSATATTSSVATTSTSASATQSAPEAKMSFRWLASNPSRLLHGIYGPPQFSTKLACFDIDGTLIAPASGAKFPKSAQDWIFWCGKGNVQARLKEYHSKGYSIVFVSNQNYPPNHKSHQNFKAKMPLIGKALGIPFRVLAATAKDEYRKPDIGMWRTIAQTYAAQGVIPDKSCCFYVGDAAGRPARTVKAPMGNGKFQTRSFVRDHHDTDKGWAKNVGIKFYTPEEFFWDRKDEQALEAVPASEGDQAVSP